LSTLAAAPTPDLYAHGDNLFEVLLLPDLVTRFIMVTQEPRPRVKTVIIEGRTLKIMPNGKSIARFGTLLEDIQVTPPPVKSPPRQDDNPVQPDDQKAKKVDDKG